MIAHNKQKEIHTMYSSSLRFNLFILLFFVFSNLFGKTDKYRCIWTSDPATTMTIGWNQVSGEAPTLYYDIYNHGYNIQHYNWSQAPDRQVNAKGMNNNFVRLTGLQPGTVYYFVIADSEGMSKTMSFRTAPDHPYERLSIIAGGDSRNYRSGRQNANMLVGKLRPHCVMFGGDMTGSDKAREWKYWLDDWQLSIGDDGRLTPLIVARGNHEYSNKSIIDMFDVQNSNIYYALNIGGDLLRVYTLNSLIASGGNQAKWLKKDLIEHQDMNWKFAQYHFSIRPHTRGKSEQNGQYKNWAKPFHQYGVNMVVESDAHVVKTTWPIRPTSESGHHMGFIRDDVNGTVYIGEGCWGAPLRRNNDDKDWTRNSGSFNQFKWIFVSQDLIEVRTVKTDNAKEVGFVAHDDVFTPPAGLDTWKPSNGEVLSIFKRHSSEYASYVHQKNNSPNSNSQTTVIGFPESLQVNRKHINTTIQNCHVTMEATQIAIEWEVKNESREPYHFEIQRKDYNTFSTIARLQGFGQQKKEINHYKILDKINPNADAEQIKYRIKATSPSGIVKYYETTTTSSNSTYLQLSPNQTNGLLKVRYELERPGDVNIYLTGFNQTPISKSSYKDQTVGSYLQSIDMNHVDKGVYFLKIELNGDIISKYRVIK